MKEFCERDRVEVLKDGFDIETKQRLYSKGDKVIVEEVIDDTIWVKLNGHSCSFEQFSDYLKHSEEVQK